MVGGVAYHAGKKTQQGREQEAEQEARLAELENQQGSAPAAAPAPAGGISDAAMDQLKQLAELKESGVLTQEEFDDQKRRILQGS
jgi:hypothetical protein